MWLAEVANGGYQHGDDHSAMEEDARSGWIEAAPQEASLRPEKELLVQPSPSGLLDAT